MLKVGSRIMRIRTGRSMKIGDVFTIKQGEKYLCFQYKTLVGISVTYNFMPDPTMQMNNFKLLNAGERYVL